MCYGIQECFPTEPGDLTSHAKFQNWHPPRDTNYVSVVSAGDALGWGATGDLMLSCHTLLVQGDLILFITGVGSTPQHLWVAVLALLVL